MCIFSFFNQILLSLFDVSNVFYDNFLVKNASNGINNYSNIIKKI